MDNIDIIQVYDQVLNKNLNRFPPETWNPYKGGYDTARRIFRHLVHEKLKWSREEFCDNISLQVIKKYRIAGAIQGLYNNNIFPFVESSFPEWNIHPWELKRSRVPKGYWTEETTREAVRWMIESKLHWNYEDIIKNISATTFRQHHLEGMLQGQFDHSPYLAIRNAYPEEDWTILKELNGYRITFEDAQEIRRLCESGEITQEAVAKKYSISPSTVSFVVNGKVWREDKYGDIYGVDNV